MGDLKVQSLCDLDTRGCTDGFLLKIAHMLKLRVIHGCLLKKAR
jgi:hypothetical protein